MIVFHLFCLHFQQEQVRAALMDWVGGAQTPAELIDGLLVLSDRNQAVMARLLA